MKRNFVVAGDKLWMSEGEFIFHFNLVKQKWSKICILTTRKCKILEYEIKDTGEIIAILKFEKNLAFPFSVELEELL